MQLSKNNGRRTQSGKKGGFSEPYFSGPVQSSRIKIMWFVTANMPTRKISSRILTCQVPSWKSTRRSFWQIQTILKQKVVFELRVVEDTAEREVALMQKYNDLVTKDEGQFNLLFLSSRNTASRTTIATMLLPSRVSLLLHTTLLELELKSRMDL